MKSIAVFLVALFCSASFAFSRSPIVNDAVLKAFTRSFPKVVNATWCEYGGTYEVYFEENNIKCRIKYDAEGDIISTRRDYTEENLCPFLKARINEKYTGKKIFGITEIMSGDNTNYIIVLEDDKHWYHISADSNGQLSLQKKLVKA